MASQRPGHEDESESRRILKQVEREANYDRIRASEYAPDDSGDPIVRKGKAIGRILSMLIIIAFIVWAGYFLSSTGNGP